LTELLWHSRHNLFYKADWLEHAQLVNLHKFVFRGKWGKVSILNEMDAH